MSRESVASQQAALLRALLAGGPVPSGFDASRLRIEADVLRRKHGRVIAYVRPDLADALGSRFGSLFTEFAASNPKTDDVRTRDYAAAFETWLITGGHLPRPRRPFFRRPRR